MAKTVEISMESIKQGFSDLGDKLTEYFEQVKDYFLACTLYQQIAWGLIALGLILVIVAVFVW